MKKLYTLTSMVLVGLFLFSGCYKDDIDDLEKRQEELEKQFQELEESTNGQIEALSELVRAVEQNDYITEIEEIVEGEEIIGYIISFKNRESVTIYHGNDGSHPVMGVKEEDGVYYWTRQIGDEEPEYVRCPQGNKIKATGDVPIMGIQNWGGRLYWTYKIGNGEEIFIEDDYGNKVPVNGTDGSNGTDGDSFFQGVDASHNDYVTFTLVGGESFTIPKYKEISISYTLPGKLAATETTTFKYKLETGAAGVWVLKTTDGWNLTVDEATKSFTVTAPDAHGATGKALVLVSNGDDSATKTYTFTLSTKALTDYALYDPWWESGSIVGLVLRAKADASSEGMILHKDETKDSWGDCNSWAKKRGSGWGMPSVAELQEAYSLFNGSSDTQANREARDAFNLKLTEIQGTGFNDQSEAQWMYWSNQETTFSVDVVRFSNGTSDNHSKIGNSYRARAVKKF